MSRTWRTFAFSVSQALNLVGTQKYFSVPVSLFQFPEDGSSPTVSYGFLTAVSSPYKLGFSQLTFSILLLKG